MQHQGRNGRHGVLRSWWAAARSPWPTAETALHRPAPVQRHEATFDIRSVPNGGETARSNSALELLIYRVSWCQIVRHHPPRRGRERSGGCG